MEQSKNITWIDALKGIAICGIVMVHSGGGNLPSVLGTIGSMGSKCVQLFFVISAYLAYVSLDHNFNNRTTEISLSAVKDWWLKKFMRLIPLYYIAIALYTIFADGSNAWLGSEGHITVKNVLAHLFFVHGFVPHYTDSIIGVEWYLGVLAIFYICVPLIYKYIDSFEKAFALFVIGTFGCSFLNNYGYAHIPAVEDSYVYSSYFGTYWFFAQLPTLLFGILLYFVITGEALKNIRNKKLLSYALLLASVIMLAGQAYNKNVLFRMSLYTLYGFWFGGIVLSQVLWKCPILDNRFFRMLGKYSYPIYLFHYILLNWYGKIVTVQTGYAMVDWGIKYVIVMTISFGVSYVLTRFVDKPIYRRLSETLNL